MANILPVRSMIYALSYTKYKIGLADHLGPYARGFASQIRSLNSLAKTLKSETEVEPGAYYRQIEGAVASYVDLFYAIGKEKRKAYLGTLDGFARPRHIKPEQNLLLIPAVLADRRVPKEEVARELTRSLYKAPFKALYDSSKSALHILELERSMAIRRVPEHMLDGFSRSMERFGSRIAKIESGAIEPMEDERAKGRFVLDAIEFSDSSGVWVADFICEKLITREVELKKVHMLARRAHG
jgi:hypothetical protein